MTAVINREQIFPSSALSAFILSFSLGEEGKVHVRSISSVPHSQRFTAVLTVLEDIA